jgi:hypothetical protein
VAVSVVEDLDGDEVVDQAGASRRVGWRRLGAEDRSQPHGGSSQSKL